MLCYRELYTDLYNKTASTDMVDRFLQNQLSKITPDGLIDKNTLSDNHRRTLDKFTKYCKRRDSNSPREFFRSKISVMYFLQHICATKMRDGIWLSTIHELNIGYLPHVSKDILLKI